MMGTQATPFNGSPVVPGGQGVGTTGRMMIGIEVGGTAVGGTQPDGGSGARRVPLPLGHYTVTQGFKVGHGDVDLSNLRGTTVFASDGGTIIFAGWSIWGYGNAIVIAHGGRLTLYGHLDSINVRCGQGVNAGKPIGTVGSTGKSSVPHLHFELRPLPSGVPANPYSFVAL
jgi:murein DD-endopeptidase MepM/ murein hydrolase activator NlpD